ncbi:MAG: sigma 54-interacting transcriptional regulator [Myxococcota bacterium]
MATSADVDDLTRDLADLVALASHDDDLEDLLRRGLDWIERITPYDLATIFELSDDELVIRMARGKLAPKVREYRLELSSFPTVREVLETRRARAYTEHDHAHGDGDPFDGVLDLPPGHSCMVVPLCAGDERYGVLTLDRAVCEAFEPSVVNLVEVYAQVLALAIRGARERATLRRLHAQERAYAQQLEAKLHGGNEASEAAALQVGVLETSTSPAVQAVVRRAQQVARTTTPVLIGGETGTGKERLARAIHLWSPRRAQPFVTINCAAIPPSLIESELFGHVKGAFTGATKDRPGRFQIANGGTLLLDEIGELDPSLQAKLLRVLQEGTFQPVGADVTRRVDVRILAATHVDLRRAVAEGRFREDLFYRLDVFPLELPPLRERLGDLPLLAAFMLEQLAQRTGRGGNWSVSEGALQRLAAHDWPGNLRELANVLERATILAKTGLLGPGDIDLPGDARRRRRSQNAEPPRGIAPLAQVERDHIARALEHTGGKIYGMDGAAALLGLKPSTLQSRMKKHGLRREDAIP